MSPKIKKIIYYIFKMLLSKTALNTYFIYLGNLLSMVFSFLFTIVVVRILSLSDFGYFSALLSFLLVVTDISDIGIGNSLSRFLPEMAKSKDRMFSFFRTAFFYQLSIALIVTIMIIICSPLIAGLLLHSWSQNNLIIITALGIFASIMSVFFQYSFSARQKFIYASMLAASGGFLRLTALLIIISVWQLNLFNLVSAQSVSLLLLLLLSLKIAGIKFLKAGSIKGDLKKLIKFSSYIGIARGLTAIAGRLDVLMLIVLTNPVETGLYSTAAKVISIFPLLSGSFTTVIAPTISTTIEKTKLKNFMKKVILGTIGLITVIIMLMIVAGPFMQLLFGTKILGAVPIFRLLLFSMIFFVGSVPAVAVALYFLHKPWILTINSMLQLLIVFFGNLIFIPRYGGIGATYSLIIAYSITLLTTSLLCFMYYKTHNS